MGATKVVKKAAKTRKAAVSRKKVPAWVKCDCCENFVCTIHGGHAHDCACPSLAVWDTHLGLVPYEEGGDMTPAELASKVAALGPDAEVE